MIAQAASAAGGEAAVEGLGAGQVTWRLGFVLLLVAVNAFFVAAEFSLTTVDRGRAEQAAAAGDRGAPGVVAALRTLSTQLSAAQLGITITSLVLGFVAEHADG